MIFIATDILNPYKREILSQDSYNTLIDFLVEKFPDGFKRPTDISVNGHEVALANYDIELKEDDVIVLLDRAALPVGLIGGWFVTALANLAISVTLSYVANKLFAPDAPQDQGTPSSVYNLNSSQNMARYGSPIPIVYGKVRMFPSMIVHPYYKFEDDIEYLYHVMCIGQGTLTTDAIYIGEDEVTNPGDVQWKLLNKADFYNIPLRAYGIHLNKTLSTPSNIEIGGGSDGVQGDETEKYRISADASKVEFDYMLPNGLFWNNDGSLEAAHASFEFRIYTLSGTTYTEVFKETFSLYEKSIDAIQRTYAKDISSYTQDVYVSFKRTIQSSDIRVTQDLYVKRVKEIYPNEDFTQRYGDITLLAVKIKATNAVSSAGQLKVNGYFERVDAGNTMSEVLTDIYTNTTYGGGLSASDLSFPTTTETVNCAYDSNMTVFDAMRKPAIAQGYSLYLAGMDVILKKDGVNNITSGMYNEMNILRNTFKAQYLFKEEYPANDGFKCTYIDGDGWIQKSETYPSTSSRPQVVDLFGVVDYGVRIPSGSNLSLYSSLSVTAPNGIAVSGNTAYVTNSSARTITSIDITDPTNMSILDTLTGTSMSGAAGIQVSGNVAYVCSQFSDSITSIDITDPSNMVELHSLVHSTFLNYASDLKIVGNIAYVVSPGTYSIVAINISNPSAMFRISQFSSASVDSVYTIDVKDGIGYITSFNSDLIASVDLSTMTLLDTYTSTSLNGAKGVAISGNTAFVTSTNNNSITSIDITDPSNMTELDSYTSSTLDGDKSILIYGDVAYISTLGSVTNLITAIDISSPSNLSLITSLVGASGYASIGIALTNNTIFTAGYTTNKVFSVDISDPNAQFAIPIDMAKYLYKQDESRRKIVSFQTDIQGLVPQFLDKIMVSHSSLQWGEAGEVHSRAGDNLVISDALEDLTGSKTIVFRDIDGSVSDPYSITITDATNITVTGMPAWVTTNTFYTIQEAGTAKEFLVIAVKPSGESVQIDCVNYDADIYI